jgi:hypothetical protein
MSAGTAPEYTVEPCPLCAAPIIWAKDDKAAMVPVDAEVAFGGTIALRPGWDGVPLARKPTSKLAFGVKLRAVHYTTCRKGEALRKRGR